MVCSLSEEMWASQPGSSHQINYCERTRTQIGKDPFNKLRYIYWLVITTVYMVTEGVNIGNGMQLGASLSWLLPLWQHASGQHISEDLWWGIVWVALIVDINILATYTNVNPHQIHCILALFWATRHVTKAIDPQCLGQSWQLTPDDIAVMYTTNSTLCI